MSLAPGQGTVVCQIPDCNTTDIEIEEELKAFLAGYCSICKKDRGGKLCGCAFPCSMTFRSQMLLKIHELLGIEKPPHRRYIQVCFKHPELLKRAREACLAKRDEISKTAKTMNSRKGQNSLGGNTFSHSSTNSITTSSIIRDERLREEPVTWATDIDSVVASTVALNCNIEEQSSQEEQQQQQQEHFIQPISSEALQTGNILLTHDNIDYTIDGQSNVEMTKVQYGSLLRIGDKDIVVGGNDRLMDQDLSNIQIVDNVFPVQQHNDQNQVVSDQISFHVPISQPTIQFQTADELANQGLAFSTSADLNQAVTNVLFYENPPAVQTEPQQEPQKQRFVSEDSDSFADDEEEEEEVEQVKETRQSKDKDKKDKEKERTKENAECEKREKEDVGKAKDAPGSSSNGSTDKKKIYKIQYDQYWTTVLEPEISHVFGHDYLNDLRLVCKNGFVDTNGLILASMSSFLTSALNSAPVVDRVKTVILPDIHVASMKLFLNLLFNPKRLEKGLTRLQMARIKHILNLFKIDLNRIGFKSMEANEKTTDNITVEDDDQSESESECDCFYCTEGINSVKSMLSDGEIDRLKKEEEERFRKDQQKNGVVSPGKPPGSPGKNRRGVIVPSLSSASSLKNYRKQSIEGRVSETESVNSRESQVSQNLSQRSHRSFVSVEPTDEILETNQITPEKEQVTETKVISETARSKRKRRPPQKFFGEFSTVEKFTNIPKERVKLYDTYSSDSEYENNIDERVESAEQEQNVSEAQNGENTVIKEEVNPASNAIAKPPPKRKRGRPRKDEKIPPKRSK